jgi:spermidine/putrescine-binding protein
MEHSVPYTFAYAALAIRKDKIKDAEPSYAMFDRASLAGRVTLLDDMRESIGAALKSLGHSINTRDEAQLAAARDVLIRWKRNSSPALTTKATRPASTPLSFISSTATAAISSRCRWRTPSRNHHPA